MRGILINPSDQSITEMQIGKNYKEIYKVIDCDIFCCPVRFENGDLMYCDDNGLFQEQDGGIIMKGWTYPILGKILILGYSDAGNSIDAKSSIDKLKDKVVFLDKNSAERYRKNAFSQFGIGGSFFKNY